MPKPTAQTLVLIVDNEFGVLSRVTELVRAEGWNIKSLVVAESMNPVIQRLTISVECLGDTLPGVLERLGKLAGVRGIEAYSEDSHISRELMLVTMGCKNREWAIKAGEAIGAHVIDGGKCGCLTLEFTGSPEHAENLIAALKPYGIRNIARSGIVTLERPEKALI